MAHAVLCSDSPALGLLLPLSCAFPAVQKLPQPAPELALLQPVCLPAQLPPVLLQKSIGMPPASHVSLGDNKPKDIHKVTATMTAQSTCSISLLLAFETSLSHKVGAFYGQT